MTKSAMESLHNAVDLLADEIGDGTLVIERSGGNYALVSVAYLEALERKAEAYDDLTQDPEEGRAEHDDLLSRMTAKDD